MIRYDVFNGDADGICALHQLRLDQPVGDAIRITGVKRDIRLLDRVDAQAGDALTVLDVSLESNREAVDRLLARGATIDYFDHHQSGTLPAHPALRAHIDRSPEACTSVLVDRHLQGRQRRWAVVGTFGDNLVAVAARLASTIGLNDAEQARLRALGEGINYNAYGESIADLYFPPEVLYQRLSRFADPFAFLAGDTVADTLTKGMQEDLARAQAIAPALRTRAGDIVILPDAAWARRVHGTFANRLAEAATAQAHAVLAPNASGGHVVSVRAARVRPHSADTLCSEFESGGGRSAAAGINHLPADALERFQRRFVEILGQ
jgi:hypothetical protein